MCGKWTPERAAWVDFLFHHTALVCRREQERGWDISRVKALDFAYESLRRGGKVG